MDIPLEVASKMMTFICKAEDEYQKKLISKSKKKKKTFLEDLYG